MTPRDVFKLAVRLLGLVFLYRGLEALPKSLFQLGHAGLQFIHIGNIFAVIVLVGWPLALSYWLMRGAPLIVRIAYPNTGVVNELPQDRTKGDS